MFKQIQNWFDERIGLTKVIEEFNGERIPRRGGWAYTLGSLLAFLFTVQVVTGIFLLFYYVPYFPIARNATYFLKHHVVFGNILLGIHLWGAFTMIFVILIHMARVYFSGAYKKPREMQWIAGMVLFSVVTVLGLTGYMLVGNENSWWTINVLTNVASHTPFIGGFIREIARGGTETSVLTMQHIFAVHVWLLPLVVIMFIPIHLFLIRKTGHQGMALEYKNSKISEDDEKRWLKPDGTVPFFPDQFYKDMIVSLAVFAVIYILAVVVGAPIGPMYRPLALHFAPEADWYFLANEELLKYFPGHGLIIFSTFLIPSIGFGILFLLPFIDRTKERSPFKRPAATVLGILFLLLLVYLTLIGGEPKAPATV
jgi:ubiquinol-cytochrome c reductase cytochrome b subunit